MIAPPPAPAPRPPAWPAWLVAAGTVVAALRGAAPVAADELAERVRGWRAAHEAAIVGELADLLRIPNLASDGPNIRRNAEAIVALLERRGVAARLLEGHGPPAVYGELRAPGAARTVLLYAHYDGQPVDPARWTDPPWQPVLRDGPLEAGGKPVALAPAPAAMGPEWRLYARSASDDKAPIVALAAALDALRAASVAPSVNLKLLFEGEEEAGSPHLEGLLREHADLFRADLMLLADGPVHQSRRAQLYLGARGVVGVDLTVYGATRTLHSGHYGNWAPNPAALLAHLLAGLRDADGRVLAPGFYDDVREPTPAERAAIAALPDLDPALRAELGLAATEGGGAPLAGRLLLPALNVDGLEAGRVGAAAANAIPAVARARLDLRLVPDQTPTGVRRSLEAHLAGQGWHVVDADPDAATRLAHPRIVRLDWDAGYPAGRTSLDHPAVGAVARLAGEAAGEPVLILPTLGGSVPLHLFLDLLRLPVVGVPIVNHDNNQHAADENLRLQNLWDGIDLLARLLARLGPELERRTAP